MLTPRCYPGIDPMPDKMDLDYLKLLYRKFQDHVCSRCLAKEKKHPNTSYKATKHMKSTFVIPDYY